MARERQRIDVSNRPELLQLVRAVQESGVERILGQGEEDLAVLRPVKKVKRPPVVRGKPFTKDAPIFNLMGIGRSGVHDVSENVDKYLAEAYLDTHTGV